MPKKVIRVEGQAPSPLLSHVVEANGFIYLAGLVGTDPATGTVAAGGFEAECRQMLENVGRLAFALRPAALDEFGLVPALKDLSGRLEEQGGPKIELDVDLPAGKRLPAKLETAVFRITQEALTNVVKHAEAKTVHIIFACREQSVVLTVEDDGRGFSPAQVAGGGLGLVGMRERVASVNGALDIESKRDAGTRLTVEIPLA